MGWWEAGWSRTWGEEHFGNGSVHKYGRSTSGELWDDVVKEATYYEWVSAASMSGCDDEGCSHRA